MQPREIARAAAEALSEKKAINIRVLEVTDLTVMADFFVIASGTSPPHLRTLADEVEHCLEKLEVAPAHKEGHNSGNWLLLDYSSVVIHVFSQDTRDFYAIERLWADSKYWEPENL
ncbi:MAG: ribosome silencing factor [Oscillospiraceae bacterium]|nr:ribosome silencing factor [Oscillospiraceae bacterium]